MSFGRFAAEIAPGAAVVNALLNGAIGWAATRELPIVPTWGLPGVAADLLATAFGVTFGTALVMPLQARMEARRGREFPAATPPLAALAARLPRRLLARSAALGLLATLPFGAVALAALGLTGVPSLAAGPFIAMKAALSFVEGALVTPPLLLAAHLEARDAGAPR